ncbi:putative Pre-mRNA-splicing factor prp1 [Trichodelitschia bisporula]|uniref:Putative Pre-mRNA-splicing factor prp1 n=1 Tax=Trichodelitschia bisporula TaxID=703511 RepID=A0A6G1IAB7_9PEZI|nr:putative Pre-mRNA-splicing factor prp1 [Trichodelitschia bisporula]
MSSRKDFLNQPAPENYVAGLGRGATGFTTRSDLGPAREGPSEEQLKEALARRAKQLELGTPTAYGVPDRKDDDDDDERFQDPDNEVGLFANGLYDKEDDEADRIYQSVDERMEKRRKARREARERKEREEYEAKNPKISQQFADAKRALSTITDDEWANIPEVGDLTGRNRRARISRMQQRFYAVPDSVIAGARDSSQIETSISADDANGSNDAADGTMTNFAQIGAAREKQLQVRLDQAERGSATETISGTSTSIDPRGYLTSLSKSEIKAGEANIGDIARTRQLLESVTNSNPTHPPGWISAARLEEVAGKIVAARSQIMRGCKNCPKSEDVWLEAIRLHMGGNNHNAKIIAADAIKANPKSVKLWIAAMELESDPRAKKRVLRQALDHNSKSVVLWKAASNLEEDPADARLLLAKATECIPLSIELWLALARLETPENARAVLNKARRAIPTSYEVWIAACRLEEQTSNGAMVRKVMERGIKSLAKESAMLKREEWIAEAEKAESEGAYGTCNAIIENTLGWELEEDDDRKDIWLNDAKDCINRGRFETARAIYAYALRVFVNKKSVWQAAADLEYSHGTREKLLSILDKAVEACPQSDELWLQLAKEKRKNDEIDDARLVLAKAFQQNPSENIWLAAVKLEADSNDFDQARELLTRARQEAGTDRVWIKSVAFERQLENHGAALDLVNQGLQIYPNCAKLWMMKGQIYEAKGMVPKAREAYNTGTRACPKSVPLWLLASRIEEKAGITVKARSVLDRARLAVPKNAALWAESVRLERRAGNIPAANNLMAQALQELPKSGLLWSEKIMHLEQRTQRKARVLEAIRLVENDKHLFTAVGRIFWAERRLEKAANWFERALVVDSDWGDTWAWYYKFLMEYGTEEKKEDVLAKCAMAEPKHGEVWQRISKDPKNAGKKPEEILLMVVAELK